MVPNFKGVQSSVVTKLLLKGMLYTLHETLGTLHAVVELALHLFLTAHNWAPFCSAV